MPLMIPGEGAGAASEVMSAFILIRVAGNFPPGGEGMAKYALGA